MEEEQMLTKEQILDMLDAGQYKELKEELGNMYPVDIAETLEDFEQKPLVMVFRLLAKEEAAETFTYMNSDMREVLIGALTDSELEEVMEEMYLDDTVDVLEEMPANVVDRLLMATDEETRAQINQLLQYPEDSAGSIMTAEYIGLKKNMTVEQCFAYIRHHAVDSETIYTCYVMDEKRMLDGVITVKDLLLQPYERQVGDIMDTHVIKAKTTDDQELVADTMNKYGLLSMPVVDSEDRLVGIITVDDVMEVMEEEATEDFEKMAAMLPSEKPYLKTGVFTLAKNRIPWLLILMLSSTITGGILVKYENAFAAIPLLVSFIPMLMDTGGNSGSQSSTMIIRGMAVGDIEPKDILKVVWKEVRVGLIVGFVLAVVNFIRLMIQYPGNTMICLTVVMSLFCTVIVAKTIGCTLPIGAKVLKLDPAIMASPMITTIVDAVSLMVYFNLACHLLDMTV